MDLQENVFEETFLNKKIPDFVEDIRNSAKEYISIFFKHEEILFGGPGIIHSSNYVDLVIDADISSGVSAIYDALEERESEEEEDIKLVLETLNKCARRGVPKFFAAGIAIMYMEICKGIKIPKWECTNEF